MSVASASPFLRVLSGEPVWPPPVWIMRQAGRYLPEYRATRAQAGSFLRLCYDPVLATEVTLQPIRRFGFDAAILFSDILVVPDALGSRFTLAEGEGPRLDPVTDAAGLARLAPSLPLDRLSPVFEAVRRIRAALSAETALIGFCGAPWTVASYMVAGRGTPDQAPAHAAARNDAVFFAALIDLLVRSSVEYLTAQLEAGADAVQIFESHAGSLSGDAFRRLSLEPVWRIVDGVKQRRPDARVSVFARGAGPVGLDLLARGGFADALGLDQSTPLAATLARMPTTLATQGNLDPDLLIEGGEALDRGVDAILSAVQGRPHVFNLGHGITPPTPPENVARMVARIRAA